MSRAGYYAWCKRQPSCRSVEDDRLARRIEAIFEASEGTYGSPRIHRALRQAGTNVGCKRVVRLMRERGLKARSAKVYRRTPGTKRFFDAIPNRIVDLETTSTNQLWVGDVTYLKVCGKWRYLAVVMDRHSRRVIGWKLGEHRDLKLTLGALAVALRNRKPVNGLIFHSDRGVEYSGYPYRTRLASNGIIQSMKRPTEITDNAYIESFFHSMKSEATHGLIFDDDPSLIAVVGKYIRRYNRSRLHSSLDYVSPIDYERRTA